MAVTFGCPLVGPYNELCGKHLKVGQRAYATDGQSAKPHEGTNWKTGAVDDNGNLIVYEHLNWDLNEGGDHETPDLSNYYTKEEIEDKIFTFTCDIIENPEVDGEVEAKNLSATYEEIFAAYETGKTIKAIANLSDRNRLMLDLTGFTDDGFYFSNVGGDSTLVLFLGNGIVLAFITYLQLVDNMLPKIEIEVNENVENCYPSAKAVIDYVNSVIKEDPQDNSKLIITLGDKQYRISATEII